MEKGSTLNSIYIWKGSTVSVQHEKWLKHVHRDNSNFEINFQDIRNQDKQKMKFFMSWSVI